MHEAEFCSVKKLTMTRKGTLRAIERIACYRVMDVSHVYANLMRAPSIQNAFYQGVVCKALQYLKMGHSMAAICDHCLAFAIARVPTQRRINCALVFFKRPLVV